MGKYNASKISSPGIKDNLWKKNLILRLKSFLSLARFNLSAYRYNRFAVLFMLVITLMAISSAGYFWHQSRINNNQTAVADDNIDKLIARVGTLIMLPSDEKPTIATVSDPEALKDQHFFDNAKRGDKVIIYSNAKKAILYDPMANKIVNVAPINIGNSPVVSPAAK